MVESSDVRRLDSTSVGGRAVLIPGLEIPLRDGLLYSGSGVMRGCGCGCGDGERDEGEGDGEGGF